MKRITAILMTVVLLLCGAGTLWTQAADAETSGTCGEHLTWTLRDGTLTIRGTGEMTSYMTSFLYYIPEAMPSFAPWHKYAKEVRAVVVEEGVTVIRDGAFENLVNAEKVSLPQTLTSIGVGAFAYCGNLERIYIPKSVTSVSRCAFTGSGRVVTEEGNLLFVGGEDGILYTKDGTRLLHYPVNLRQTSFSIPESVRMIEEYAFTNCRYLKRLTVPGTLEKTDYAFMYCPGLEEAYIEEGLKNLGGNAFFGCKNLRRVDLPQGLESIGHMAFFDTALEYLHIPDSVQELFHIMDVPTLDKDWKNLPFMQPFFICADSDDGPAKEYADQNNIRFYVCDGTHDANTVGRRNTLLQRIWYVLQSTERIAVFFSALIP